MYRILIVDDEKVEREGVSYLLSINNFPLAVHMAVNGKEAYQKIESMNEALTPVNILLTDIKMPIMDGIDLICKIRENNLPMDIIIMSAYGEFEYTQQAIKYKVEDYLLKPIIIDEFCMVIVRSVGRLQQKQCEMEQKKALAEKFSTSPFGQKQKLFETVLFSDDEIYNLKKENFAEIGVIDTVIELIEQHYNENISLEWIAEKIYISPGYLSSLFKKETRRTVFQYITSFRMAKARELLVETNKKIVDICAEVGYNSPSYFGMQFKKMYGVSPNTIRSSNGGHNEKDSEMV